MKGRSNSNFLDRLIERMDRLDPSSIQGYILKLSREKGFLETVFNTIQEGVIVIDRMLSIRYINTAAQRLLGIQEDALNHGIDRYLRDIEWNQLLDADPDQWRSVSRQEIEVFYPVHRYLSFYIVPTNADEDELALPLATLILRDVTDVHEDTAKTIESQRVEAITMLAAGVAHELGNPLNSLNIHLQLLGRCIEGIEDEDLADEARELLDVASHEVTRLDSIVNNFLRAVRPAPLKMEHLTIQKLLGEVLAFLRVEIENRNIHVEASWPDTLPVVMGDRDQIKQAFHNVIRNAVQAMADGGLLEIACSAGDSFLNIRFTDSGSGISPENLSRIMEPYFSTRSEGTGLGLLIVNRIIRSHGGELAIESIEGEGTSLTLRLPLHERQVRLLAAARDAREAGAAPISPDDAPDSTEG